MEEGGRERVEGGYRLKGCAIWWKGTKKGGHQMKGDSRSTTMSPINLLLQGCI